ncbi:MAG: peptidase T [Tannerellaceae bacterium]|jgi:tripeptide aminopeptidase|nr:peptidase T [Tannerellaceae bacterium]
MNLTERFLKYASFDTQSDEASTTTPSSRGQRILAEEIANELRGTGMQDITLDDNGYLMATLPSNSPEEIPVIGFIAHLDTSPDMSGKGVAPRIVKYSGGDIMLSPPSAAGPVENPAILSPDVFPELNKYIGQEIIVTDGSTLLGADDKAGIAAIVSAMQYLCENPEVKHGAVRIAFTPDEEIGRGADRFDVERFGCRWAYTVDGGEVGELEYENFNAAVARVTFKGLNVHPGTAKGKMRNAGLMAAEFAALMPEEMRPERTEGYEGFYHLVDISGNVEEATLTYLIREHDRARFEACKELLRTLCGRMSAGRPGSVAVHIKDQYYNMSEVIKQNMHAVRIASEAMEAIGITPVVKPIRGGTDGARLSFMGLPCPNLFAGGHNFHSRYEYLPVRSLELCKQTIIKIIELL